jgi:hypothetical protein
MLDKILRVVLIGVAAIDLILGFLILFAPHFFSATFKLSLPSEISYVWLLGMLQIMVAVAYLIGGLSPARHVGNVILAAIARVAMGVLLIFIGVTQNLTIFTLLGFLEIPIGLSHAVYAARLLPEAGIA